MCKQIVKAINMIAHAVCHLYFAKNDFIVLI
jgi:hypothetical protein